MRIEQRIAAVAVGRVLFGVLLMLLVLAAGSYRYFGPSPLWFALVFGIPVILLVGARLILARSSHGWDTVRRGCIRVRRLVERALASVRGARRRRRVRRVERAALEVAADDDLLSPESVRTAAESLFRLVQRARDAHDPGRLATLLGPELLAESERALAEAESSGAHERWEVVGDVRVEYVGFTTPDAGQAARAVVLIEAELSTSQGRGGRRSDGTRRLCQYWTLGFLDGAWTVLAIEDRVEGRHHLAEPVGVPSAVSR